MPTINTRRRQAKLLRIFRKIHKTTGALLFVFFLIISITGVLLGWKKNSNGFILPKSYTGTSSNFERWLPIDSLHKNACRILHDSVSADLLPDLDRIDINKEKGMVKFIFSDHYWGIQIDGVTGRLLHIDRRWSDYIENVHDGSILDHYFGTKGEKIKLVYTTLTGLSLLMFSVTGFWLWYGTKRLRKHKKKKQITR